ncbi:MULTISPECIES: PTS transporter subunit EIIC [Lactobacillus]|uniref:N(Pi)-phosphohistidine--sugar phosphotransferase n=1 Tax=Lactobacillus melliventris TaxID=1218507 RepID=A0A0F4LIN0_9LACO|nr:MULTISPECIES: PTS transporter subunit EIIC [Lactobacillus]KJY58193.1 PTS Glc IIBC [Lactobacillus melliventris]MBC6349449.1 N(pi)-phosphohistidine--sugar phosphotransferase [Lactobacillus melliventris]MBH9988899.1 PTS transporter subunit EIIC [Lactobacillus sp. M0392]MBI0023482.1 PTS transporter subunit EIIC [Lactobacillus sp. W8171]MBI0043887.1 PTS transporter subunit EIIC [Lactobacillus sp. M0393]
MKGKFMKSANVFSRAIIQPVMFMAVTGIILSVCAILKLDLMPTILKDTGNFIYNILSSGMIGQLSCIFCVGIATALAKPKYKTDAAILGIVTYLIFLFANNSWLQLTHRLAKPNSQGLFGTGQNMVFGIQVTDMGVFLGIILGILVGWMVNKWGNIKLHKYLSPYAGTKSVYIILVFVTILFAIAITYVWPAVNWVIENIVKVMSTTGSIGFFFYGFLNRMLLPVGLHHFLWMPLFYTPLGGTARIAGKLYTGAFNIWLAELGNPSHITAMHQSIGYLSNFGSISLPIGIAFAFWKMSEPKNRQKVAAILIPTVTTAFLAGVTEPLEFMFLFLSPLLWLAHSVVYGISLFLTNIVGIDIQFDTGINMIINSFAFPARLGHQYLIPIMFVVTGLLEYFVFVFMIKRFNIPTIGRANADETLLNGAESEDESVEQAEEKLAQTDSATESADTAKFDNQTKNIVAGLGGPENIDEMINCYTRLRVDVKDTNKLDMDLLKHKTGTKGVMQDGNNIQIVFGVDVESIHDKVDEYLDYLKKHPSESGK